MQCCLLCGRTLTDRKAHDALEEQVLKSIRDEHPEWTDDSGACEPCVGLYRQLLKERETREERVRAHLRRQWPQRLLLLRHKLRGRFHRAGKTS